MADTLWTKEQEAAITLTGNNMLVSAAAGAGKTSVLVERIIRKVLSPRDPLDLERLLVVTFTEKAASEMKERIRSSLEAAVRKSPGDTRIERQLALLDRAQISTIHAFCLRVLRRYYFRVNLDPSFKVLDANEAELIRMEALEELFEDLYDDPSPYGDLFRSLVERFGGRAVDEGLQSTALRLHEFVRSQPSVTEFFQLAKKRASGHDLIWLTCLASRALQDIRRAKALVEEAKGFCVAPGGPHSYLKALDDDLLLFSGAEVLVDGLFREAKAAAGGEVASQASFVKWPARWLLTCPPRRSQAESRQRLRSRPQEQGIGPSRPCQEGFRQSRRLRVHRPLDEVMSEMAEVAPFTAGLCDIVEDLDRRYTARNGPREAWTSETWRDIVWRSPRWTAEGLRRM